jgi:hypothetical protein
MILRTIILLFSFTIASTFVRAELPEMFEPERELVYLIRLTNGDLLTGIVVDVLDTEDGKALKVKTEIGTALIYANQISSIYPKTNEYKHSHRAFLLPTAEPIGSHIFAGDFELVFLMAGFGISDIFSFTAGHSFIPFVPARHQLTNFNAKFTLYKMYFEEGPESFSLALGGNFAYANHNNRLAHLYGAATVDFGKTMLTANVFYKLGYENFYDIYFEQYLFNLIYPNGAFGIGLGLDSRLPGRSDLHVIGELWNIDVTRPTNTAIMLGLRFAGKDFSADFGLALFTQPFIAPFMSFVWTPL